VLYHWKNHLKAIEGGAADSPIRELRKQVRDLKRVLAETSVEGCGTKFCFTCGCSKKNDGRRGHGNCLNRGVHLKVSLSEVWLLRRSLARYAVHRNHMSEKSACRTRES
jgi:hypothetical protein